MSLIVDPSEIYLELGLSSSVTDEERGLVQAAIQKASGAVIRYLKYDPEQKIQTEYLPHQDFSLRSRDFVWETTDTDAFIRRLATAATNELQVTHIPVRETDENGDNPIVLNIDFDGRSGTRSGAFGADTLKIEGDDFWPNYDSEDSNAIKFCGDGIIRSLGRWPSVSGSVKIVYVGGFTRTELHGQDSVVDASPLFDVVVDETVRRVLKAFNRRKRAGVGFTGPFLSERLGDYSYRMNTKILETLIGSSWDLTPENRENLNDYVKYDLGVT